jgi:p-hydroxybenzoate 3-monooxygenase
VSGTSIRTQVCIIGAGPAGSLLSHLLSLEGITSVVLERASRRHVLDRIRAGVLEQRTATVLRDHGLGHRMDIEGHPHDGTGIVWQDRKSFFIDIARYTSTRFTVYGQNKIQEDLYAAADARDAVFIDEVDDIEIHDISSGRPNVTYVADGRGARVDCDYVAGCDGFHGVSRSVIPSAIRTEYHKDYPFGWLGILSETPPLPDIVYAHHRRGFAMASTRGPMLSRYYLQCPLTDSVDDWSDDRFWDELMARFPSELTEQIVTGPSVEKSIAPLRSFVCEPMQYGNLYLAGDAAHIVPPTGAKGLNLAVADVSQLAQALVSQYRDGDHGFLDAYSDTALRRVWGAVRFSWWLTRLLHQFPDMTEFDNKAQEVELDFVTSSEPATQALCDQYAGVAFP